MKKSKKKASEKQVVFSQQGGSVAISTDVILEKGRKEVVRLLEKNKGHRNKLN